MTCAAKLTAVVLAAVFITACNAEPAQPVVRDYRALVYTEAFRARFSLASSGVRTLQPGLQAITLRVIDAPYAGRQCFLDVYLDGTVEFDYPEGDAGRLEDVQPYGRMFFARQLSDADSKFVAERWHKPRFVYRSKDHDEHAKRGVRERGGIVGYDRAIAPGLSVVTLAVSQRTLDPDHAPAHLYLLRAGQAATALDETAPNDEHVYVFNVPASLLRDAATATREAARGGTGEAAALQLPEFSVPPR